MSERLADEDLHMQVRFERLPQPEEGRLAFWHVCCLVLDVSCLIQFC